MNAEQYLNSKGYSYKHIAINRHFNFFVYKEGKQILHITINSNISGITQQEFEKQLFDVVKNQIEIYESELEELNVKTNASCNPSSGCEEVRSTVEESNKVS